MQPKNGKPNKAQTKKQNNAQSRKAKRQAQIDKRLKQRTGRANNNKKPPVDSKTHHNDSGDRSASSISPPSSTKGHAKRSNPSPTPTNGTLSPERRQHNSSRYQKLRQRKQGPSASPSNTRSESPSNTTARSFSPKQSVERNTRTNHERSQVDENAFEIKHLNPSFLPEPTTHPLPTPVLDAASATGTIEPVVQQFDKKTMLQHKSEIQQLQQAELHSDHSSQSPPHASRTPDPHIQTMHFNHVQSPSPNPAPMLQPAPQPAASQVMIPTQMACYQQLVQQGQVFITQGQYYQQLVQQMAFQPASAPPIQVLPVPPSPPLPPRKQHISHGPKKAFNTQQLADSQLLFLPTGGCVRLPNCPSEASGTVDSLVLDLALPTLNHKQGVENTHRRIRKILPLKLQTQQLLYPVQDVSSSIPMYQNFMQSQFIPQPTIVNVANFGAQPRMQTGRGKF